MTKQVFTKKMALAGCALMAAAGLGRAQIACSGTDTGSTTFTPGSIDISQLLCSLSTGTPGGLNWYWDNGTPNGSTFTTGNNAGGYILNSLAVKTIGGGGSNGQGNEFLFQPYAARIYSVQVTPSATNATLLAYYLTAPFSLAAQGNWVQVSGMSTVLAPNTEYAYTYGRTLGGYECLGFTNGIPGGMCEIPTGGGSINFGNGGAATYSATYDIGLNLPTALTVNPPIATPGAIVSPGTVTTLTSGLIADNAGNGTYTYQWQTDGGSGTLTNIPGATAATLVANTSNLGGIQYAVIVTDSTSTSVTSSSLNLDVRLTQRGTFTTTAASTLPSPGAADIYQFTDVGNFNATASAVNQGGLNYYTDNGTKNDAWMGETFTTGSNPKGYSLSSMAVCLDGTSTGSGGGLTGTLGVTYDLYLFKLSADLTTCSTMALITNYDGGYVVSNYPTWFLTSFPTIQLASNSVYGYAIGRNNVGSSYIQIALSGSANVYAGGTAASFPAEGGPVTAISTMANGVFDAGMTPNGVPFLLTSPVATPNPAYAQTPVKLACNTAVAGSYTYKWLTDDGTGAIPPNYEVISGSNATNLTVVPYNAGADYTTNYYFVATRTADNISVTSSVVTLTVHAASVPLLSTISPANAAFFVGATATLTLTENGTFPITNQWSFDNGSGGVTYSPLTGKNNTTLVLPNLQLSQTGDYQLGATNIVGNANATATVTVLPVPGPIVSSQIFSYQIETNHPWAFWRLNETNDPTAVGAPTFPAYDSSGNGFTATYGNLVTVNNPGPQAPAWPGLETTNLAAGTESGSYQGVLTVPNLHMTGNSNVTFMAWINPNSVPAGSAGLLFNRNGPDGACGFGFSGSGADLGYTWDNNSPNTYGYDSGLAVQIGSWNFVAWVITPTNTSTYLGYVSGAVTNFTSAVQTINNTAETFGGGTIELGGDVNSTGRNFNGLISDAALFTNAMTQYQIQAYFATSLGVSALPAQVSSTAGLPSTTVLSGQNITLVGGYSGTPPVNLQWQSSPDASTWVNVPGGTTNNLLINPLITGTVYYQLIARNALGSSTSSAPVTVTFLPPPTAPAALWSINFQSTNNISDSSQDEGTGPGQYVGRGALGTGTYWNILPCVVPSGLQYNAPTVTNVTDFLDNGVTHSGITCQFNGVGQYDAVGSTLAAQTDIRTLLDQWSRSYSAVNAIQLTGLPAGTYNVVCYGGNGYSQQGSANLGTMFVVHDALNGNQTGTTACLAPTTSLQQGVNFLVFTGVHTTGAMNLDAPENTSNGSPNAGAGFEGLQLQLVSYDPPTAAFTGAPTNAFVGQPVAFVNNSVGSVTNAMWTFGDGTSVTNTSTAGVTHSYAAAGTYTVSLTVSGLGGGPNTVSQTSYIGVYPTLKVSSAVVAAGKLVLSGVNGTPGEPYRVLSTTNLLTPLTNWTTVSSGFFGVNGGYNFTNAGATSGTSFYRLVTP